MATSWRAVVLAFVMCAQGAGAQDTLSDAAWKADRDRRAALRAQSTARLDSAATLVDSVIARPGALTLQVGDSLLLGDFLHRMTITGQRRGGGSEIAEFAKSVGIKPNASLMLRNGFVVALAAGTAEFWLRSGARVPDLFAETRPHTRVFVTVR